MPVSMAATIIAWMCGGASASSAASSASSIRRRRLLSSRSFLISVSEPRLNGVRVDVLAADRPVQHVAEQVDDAVDARGAEHAGAGRRPTTRGFCRSAMRS